MTNRSLYATPNDHARGYDSGYVQAIIDIRSMVWEEIQAQSWWHRQTLRVLRKLFNNIDTMKRPWEWRDLSVHIRGSE